MASVDKRPPRTVGGAFTYRVRYRDPSGASRSKSFPKKAEAERYANTVEADKSRGVYLDPTLGRLTLGDYADGWLKIQTFDESTREAVALRLRVHIKPVLGQVPLADLRPSLIQSWLSGLQQKLAPRTVKVILANLSSMLSAAVDDDRLGKNPCSAGSIRAPRHVENKVVVWTLESVLAVRAHMPERFQLAATLAAGLGLRQGEVFGLAVEDVDFLRGVVHVRRQVKIVGNRQIFALPKGGRTRDVPLAEDVRDAIQAHLRAFPAVSVSLPWQLNSGQPKSFDLLLSTRERTALQRNYINSCVWKPAVKAAGLPTARTDNNGMHALRHFYASVLLEGGASIRALADYLGHRDPGFTLRVYAHLMPQSEDTAKRAINGVFGGSQRAVNDPLCVPGVSRRAS